MLLKLDERTYGGAHPKVAVRCTNLAIVLTKLGELDDAFRVCARALHIFDEASGAADGECKREDLADMANAHKTHASSLLYFRCTRLLHLLYVGDGLAFAAGPG